MIKEKINYSFYYLNKLFAIILCRILTAPVGRVWRLIAFSYSLFVVSKGKNEECKLSPLVGESVNC